MITQERLKELVVYNKTTGIFKWNKSRQNSTRGEVAGHKRKADGYIIMKVDGERCLAHRLAFLYIEGEIPKCVDHINRNTSDNRWKNLRSATPTQNRANCDISKNNTSGYKGVSLSRGKWQAMIKKSGKCYFLGRFNCPKKAHEAYLSKRKEIYGDFA